jgi:hypothetical protein
MARSEFHFVKALYWPLLAVLCAVYSCRVIGGGADVWAHAAVGRWIIQHGQIPHQSLFLWSAHEPWIAHSWLSQICLYGLLSLGGPNYGPVLTFWGFNSVLSAASFYVAWRLWRLHAPLSSLAPFLFLIAIQASNLRFQARPESFSALFLAILLALLSIRSEGEVVHGRRGNIKKWLFIPALFTLWANFHGGVTVGVVILIATLICDALQLRFSSATDADASLSPASSENRDSVKFLGVVTILAIAATLVNPYGLSYWQALESINSFTFQWIEEWKPFWTFPALVPELIIAQALLFFGAILSWLATPPVSRRCAHLAWLLVMTVLFLSARRYAWLLALTSLSVLAANARSLDTVVLWRQWQQARKTPSGDKLDDMVSHDGSHESPDASQPPKMWRCAVRLGTVAALIACIAFAPWPPVPWKPDSILMVVPRGMADLLRRHPERRVFNDYSQSPYLQWRLGGKPPLFIDTLNAYPDLVMIDYLEIRKASPHGQALLQQRSIDTVALPRLEPNEAPPGIFYLLDHDPHWRLVYLENDGIVWLRDQTRPPRSPR